MTALKRASAVLALNRQTASLLIAILMIGAGEEMWMRFLPKYLEALGSSVFLIAAFDAIKTLLGALYAYPGGYIADRFGHRAAFMGFTGVSIAGYLMVVLLPSPGGVIAAMFLFLAWSDFSLPATFSLVASALPANKHAMGIGMQSLIRRIPVIAGPIAGGILIDRMGIVRGVRTGAGVSIVLALFAGLLLVRLVRRSLDPPALATSPLPSSRTAMGKSHSRSPHSRCILSTRLSLPQPTPFHYSRWRSRYAD